MRTLGRSWPPRRRASSGEHLRTARNCSGSSPPRGTRSRASSGLTGVRLLAREPVPYVDLLGLDEEATGVVVILVTGDTVEWQLGRALGAAADVASWDRERLLPASTKGSSDATAANRPRSCSWRAGTTRARWRRSTGWPAATTCRCTPTPWRWCASAASGCSPCAASRPSAGDACHRGRLPAGRRLAAAARARSPKVELRRLPGLCV